MRVKAIVHPSYKVEDRFMYEVKYKTFLWWRNGGFVWATSQEQAIKLAVEKVRSIITSVEVEL